MDDFKKIIKLLEKQNERLSRLEKEFFGSKVILELDEFKAMSDVIVANRLSAEIMDSVDKIYTRDLFGED